MIVSLFVRLKRDEAGYPPFGTEELHAEEVGDHLYRLTDTPVFAFGLARGDVVHAAAYPNAEGSWVDRLMEAGEHSSIRVVLSGGSPLEPLRSVVAKHGLNLEVSKAGVIGIDVPPEYDLGALWIDLVDPTLQGQWDVGIGVLSDTHERGGANLERPTLSPS